MKLDKSKVSLFLYNEDIAGLEQHLRIMTGAMCTVELTNNEDLIAIGNNIDLDIERLKKEVNKIKENSTRVVPRLISEKLKRWSDIELDIKREIFISTHRDFKLFIKINKDLFIKESTDVELVLNMFEEAFSNTFKEYLSGFNSFIKESKLAKELTDNLSKTRDDSERKSLIIEHLNKTLKANLKSDASDSEILKALFIKLTNKDEISSKGIAPIIVIIPLLALLVFVYLFIVLAILKTIYYAISTVVGVIAGIFLYIKNLITGERPEKSNDDWYFVKVAKVIDSTLRYVYDPSNSSNEELRIALEEFSTHGVQEV